MYATLFLLLAGHALGDFALQNDYVAKNKYASLPVMLSHCLIHGAIVYLVTNSLLLGLVETVLHWIIDSSKGANRISFNTDQALHVACKLGYIVWLYFL